MRFSVALHNAYEGLGYPIGFARDAGMFARLARTAEALGYEGIWANDHLVVPRSLRDASEAPRFHEPLVVLAHVAAHARRIRVGTAVLALPLRDPALLASQARTLQALTDGRLVLGVGRGAYPEERGAVPGAAERATRFDETLAALRRLLDAPPSGPAQRIPIYVGGHGVAALERAARVADGWIPGWQPPAVLRERITLLRERLDAGGRARPAVVIAPELSALVDERHDDAVRRYEASGFVRHRRARDRSGRDLSLMTASNLVGSPEAIREKVAALAAAGVDECAALAFPAESEAELVEQWTRFAEAVIRPRA